MADPTIQDPVTDLNAPRTCRTCGETKTYADFSKDSTTADKIAWHCKACQKAKNAASYARNADKRRAYANKRALATKPEKAAYNAAYRAKNRSALVEYAKEWRKTHKVVRSEEAKARHRERSKERYASDPVYRQRIQEQAKRFRQGNPEKVKAWFNAWLAKNRNHMLEYRREYHRRTSEAMTQEERQERWRKSRERNFLQRSLAQAARRSERAEVPGVTTNAELFWVHKWQDNRCLFCSRELPEDRRGKPVEHIIPIKRFGTNHPYNVVRTCANCNFSRQEKIYSVEWNPKEQLPADRFHSAYCTAQLRKALSEADVSFENNGTHLSVAGRPVFILSTFWMSSRTAPIETLETLRAKHPTAVFFFDHEWRARPDSLKSVVLAKAGLSPSYGARQTEVEVPSIEEARVFLDQWHTQGFAGGSWTIGLKHAGEWQAMAVFQDTKKGYDLARMAFRGHVSGGMSKLIQAFLKVAPEKKDITSFCDLRFGAGSGYEATGFRSTGDSLPVTAYANVRELFHWWVAKKQNLTRWDYYNENLSDVENLRANGVFRLTLLPRKKFILTAK
jgi:ribosomal protein L37E